MSSFVLPIFPEGSLATSIITTVWVGLFVVCFFNLRFGWNLSGLIVPGYLVPLLILKPWSGVANIIEAIITYLIVRFFSELGHKTGLWSIVFGRDRFFCILVFAVIVRLICDMFLFPELTTFLGTYFNINFVYRGGLYSIGLVIVALVANQFWNQGFKRGFPHFVVIIAITYILIQYVLVAFTNFRLSEVAFLYEGVAQSIVASPRAYIILLIAAFLASRMNLLYGWEFSGIVIPALLALEWYYPWKILTSVIEAFIVYGVAIAILKTSIFRNITIEGSRKLLLFFNIAFFYKMLIGFVVPYIFPNVIITDYYGLGYMLTSLIAIKMYDKKLGVRIVGITLETSLKAVIVATLVGFFIFYLPFNQLFNYRAIHTKKTAVKHTKTLLKNTDLIDTVLHEQINLYNLKRRNNVSTRIINTSNFVEAMYAVKNYIRKRKPSSLDFARNMLNSIDFSLEIVDNSYILIYDNRSNSFRGIFAYSLEPKIKHTLAILYPKQSPALAASLLGLFKKYSFSSFAIGGIDYTSGNSEIFKHESNSETLFYTFINYTKSTSPSIFFFMREDRINNSMIRYNPEIALKNNTDYIFTPKKHYENINLFFEKILVNTAHIQNDLKSLFPYFPKANHSMSIYLSTEGLTKLMKESPYTSKTIEVSSKPLSNTGFFASLNSYIGGLFAKKKNASDHLVELSIKLGHYIDTQVITPILNANTNNEKTLINKLNIISVAAKTANLSLQLNKLPGKKDFLFVTVKPTNKNNTNEIFLLNVGNFSPYIITVIPPATKSSLDLAIYLTSNLNPHALLMPHNIIIDKPTTNPSSKSSYEYKRSLMYLITQVVVRETDKYYDDLNISKQSNKIINNYIQIRPIESDDLAKSVKNTVFISTSTGAYNKELLTPRQARVYDKLKTAGLTIKFVNGSKATAGMEACNISGARYLSETSSTDFMVIWFPNNFKLKINK
ncbi:MAG TPA: poly-gamma-glutamate biosynthesis protein PgsC/CapC [Victivallales bacterium]|nr:poly-gamma-glutamate biosynthesis protein PgsC/CapC [Victivallales bacterium]